MLKPGWYILNYHEINWEESDYLRPIGGSFPPDVFFDHCEALSNVGRLVSIQEGEERLASGRLDEPLISFWFDDGLIGNRRYAKPILDSFGIGAAVSVNSRFTDRQEMFWRFKLGFLQSRDGMRFVRSRLRKKGYKRGDSVRSFVLDHFDEEIVRIIDEVYQKFTDEPARTDAFRAFDTWDGLRELAAAGWVIANHSAAHYPVSEPTFIDEFAAQFLECEERFSAEMGEASRYWVAPFDRGHRAEDLMDVFAGCGGDRNFVLVGNKVNQPGQDPRLLYRISMWEFTAKQLVSLLSGM